ncbi:MAG: DUF2834 domain-containing protein [Spirochaetia bacterium]|nr:DUF2834 domain-containing protein [Spirochaetia bacterium]
MKRTIYLVIAILGIILPMSQFIPASLAGDFSVGGMLSEMTATRTLTGISLDFLVAVTAGMVFGFFETRRLKIRLWVIPLAGTFFIGFSFGLPFFLYLRETALEASREVKT